MNLELGSLKGGTRVMKPPASLGWLPSRVSRCVQRRPSTWGPPYSSVISQPPPGRSQSASPLRPAFPRSGSSALVHQSFLWRVTLLDEVGAGGGVVSSALFHPLSWYRTSSLRASRGRDNRNPVIPTCHVWGAVSEV